MSNPGIQIKMSNCLFKYYFSLKIYVAGVQKITVSKNVEHYMRTKKNEPVHEISNNVVSATSKASDQPAHTRSLIRAFVSRLSIL